MVDLSCPEGRVFRLIVSILVFLVLYPPIVNSEVFNVTNEDELREALSIAESNGDLIDVVTIGGGVYQTSGEPFTFESDGDFSLTLEGEGAGITILDGGNETQVLRIVRSGSVGFVNRSSIVIKGVTIRNGFANGSGGGVFVSNTGFADISENEFSDNNTNSDGGGVYIAAEELTMSDNEFIGNSSGVDGGGAYVISAFFKFSSLDTVITNNIFVQNSCAREGCGGGGALFSSFDRLTLTNNSFALNSTERFGSALKIENIPFILDDGTTSEFIVTNIYNNIVIANDIIDGSDILATTSPPPIPTPPPPGVTLRPETFDYGTVNVFNNDVVVFRAATSGCFFENYTCLLEINDSNNIDLDPLFVDAAAGDVSLQPDSPCIDAGDPNAPDVPNTDFFGNPRVPPPDMGAVEFIPPVVDLHGGGGGCSITHTPVTSSLAVFLALPVLILIRRVVKKQRV